MKTTRILLLLISCSFYSVLSQAQSEKGSMLLGGNASMSFSSQQNIDQFNMYVNPRIGFFAISRFALGASLPLSLNTSRDYESWNIGIGPFIRYYLGKGKINPFLEAIGGLSRSRYRYREPGGSIITNTANTRNFGLGLGLAYFITPAISLECILSYNSTRTRENRIGSTAQGRPNLNIGFQIYLPRHQE